MFDFLILFFFIANCVIIREMPANANSSGSRDCVNELNDILHEWEETHNSPGNDPVHHLIQLCELFELHTINFLKKVSLLAVSTLMQCNPYGGSVAIRAHIHVFQPHFSQYLRLPIKWLLFFLHCVMSVYG